MSIFIRIWFFFSLVVVLSLSFIAYTLTQQVKPNVRQVVEDTPVSYTHLTLPTSDLV